MTIFWILAAGLAGLAVLFVVTPLARPQDESDAAPIGDEAAANRALFHEQLAELDADLAVGKLDQAQYDAARRDLEREALFDLAPSTSPAPTRPAAALPSARLTLIVLALMVPLSGVALYLGLGDQDIIGRLEAQAGGPAADAPAGHGGGADGMPALDVLLARLEERMQQSPDDAEGWMMLGRTYFAMGDPAKAESALERAYALTPQDPQLLLAYAEVIASNNQNSLDGRPAELISAALAADPDNTTARWLTGMVSFQRGQYNAAATAWKTVLAQLDPASEDATELAGLIHEAEARAGVPPSPLQLTQANGDAAPTSGPAPTPASAPAPAPAAAPAPTPAPTAAPVAAAADSASAAADAAGGAAIEVDVSLSPELAAGLPPTTTVFVYAKAAAGPPMPLAVHRATVADLPLRVRLDDAMAMMPAMRLSAFPQVIVGARVSPSGLATPRPGDLEGEVGPVSSSGAAPVAVRIDRVRP